MAKTEKTYVDVTDVPLFKVGQWSPVQGDGTVTRDQLEAIAAAGQDDRLDAGVIKLGHFDDRFDNPDYFGDGEPAYGQVVNLRVADDEGGTLLGDLKNVPADLADVMASAYPYRSVEITRDVELLDAEGKTIEKFPHVLTGLALLGSAPPAVSGLGAIHEAFSKQNSKKTATVVVDATGHFALAAGHTFESLRQQVRTALGARTASNEYIYIADMDDQQVIYELETDGGALYQREAFTINSDGTVALSGQPESVVRRTVFEPVAQNSVVPHFSKRDSDSVSVHAKRAPEVAGTTTPTVEEGNVTEEQIKALREQGLIAADVTNETVLAALGAPAAGETEQEAEDEAEAEVEAPAGDKEPVLAGKATVTAPETVTVSAAAFAEMQTRMSKYEKTVKDLEARETAQRHDTIIATAKREGRLHPKDEANFRTLLAENEAATTTLLASLQPTIHTQEIGSAVASFAAGTEDAVLSEQMKIDNEFMNGGK